MADWADISDERIDLVVTDSINHARNALEKMPVGAPGECDRCGENMPRLINGTCCKCVDKWRNQRVSE